MQPKAQTAVSEPDAYAWYVLGVLFVAYVFNFVDRNILSILLQPIKEDLGVSDTAMGFLTGFAFAVFYALMGLPIARWADVGSRRSILALGLALWSAMTVVSGLARSFAQLAIARVGVGVGEAAGSPPSHSLISDYFPPERRGTALSVYAMGNYVGMAVAFIGGGWINEVYGWRAAFIIVGLPGLALAVLVRATVREPPREGGEDGAPAAPVREVLRFLREQRSYVWLNVAGAFSALLGYGFGIWAATFMIRVHEMGTAEVGGWIGVLGAGGGVVGTLIGGALTDRLTRKDARWYMWLPAVSCFANLPINVAFLLGSKGLALAAFGPHALIHALYVGPLFATMQAVARPRMRALAVAIHMLIVNLLGLGVGPLVVGMLNDGLHARLGDEAIRYSLLLVTASGAVAGVFYLLSARTLRGELERAGAGV